MSDRSKSGDRQQRSPGADRGREGFGDDGGSRVGRPDPAHGADQHTGPSSQPVKEGIEGAIFEDEEGARGGEDSGGRTSQRLASQGGGKSTGAGAEAAEGAHNAMRDRSPRENSGVDAASDQLGRKDDKDEEPRRGSEPLAERDREHVSGYGGAGGSPKRSSDQR